MEDFDDYLNRKKQQATTTSEPSSVDILTVCPTCNEKAEMYCKCHMSDRWCKNKHHWIPCPEHKKMNKRWLVPEGFNTHGGTLIDCENKCT